jgi:hypothetical protein
VKTATAALIMVLMLGGGSKASVPRVTTPPAQVATAVAPLDPEQLARMRVVRDVLIAVGDLTARVALAPDRAGRMAAARMAAGRVRELVDFVRWADGEASPRARMLHELAFALDRYDLPRIALLSDLRADAVVALERQLAPAWVIVPDSSAREGGS